MSEQTQERAMFTHPYISSALAGDRQRERLARRTSSAWYASCATTPGRLGAHSGPSSARAAPCAQSCGCAQKCRHDITTGQHGGPRQAGGQGRSTA